MSQLSRLIEQARKTRRVNEIFNIQPGPGKEISTGVVQEDEVLLGSLADCLADLERRLFESPSPAVLPVDQLVNELEDIVQDLS